VQVKSLKLLLKLLEKAKRNRANHKSKEFSKIQQKSSAPSRSFLKFLPLHTGADPGGAIGAIAPPKTYESNFFTMILYNSERHLPAN